MEIKLNDRIVGNYYVAYYRIGDDQYVYKYKDSGDLPYIHTKRSLFNTSSNSSFNNGYKNKLADSDQIEHLEQCIKAKKYINYKPKPKELYPIF